MSERQCNIYPAIADKPEKGRPAWVGLFLNKETSVSRSYCKALSERGEDYLKNCKKHRAQCRLFLRQLAINPELGDIAFPLYKQFPATYARKNYNLMSEIRNEFNLEIIHILCGHFYTTWSPSADEHFIEAFNKIKGIIPGGGRPFLFEWLEGKKAKKAVKAWRGEPLELLRHLTRRGIIEQAARRRFRLRTGK